MVDFQSGLWYSDNFKTFAMWYEERPPDGTEALAYYQKEMREEGEWADCECGTLKDDRLVVNYLLTSWR